jgi:hypothetical protein
MARRTPSIAVAAEASPDAPWSPAARLAFRFFVVYLGLFALATQISGSLFPNPSVSYRGLGRLWPMRDITTWVGQRVLDIEATLDPAGMGEPLFFWVQTFWILVIALIATAIWSWADRVRSRYSTLYAWTRLVVRVALAASLFEYGMTKMIPTQFPAPALTTLVTPVGDLSLSGLLWASVGASPAYQILTGCVEVLAGILLLVSRTTVLGAAIGLVALLQVFALNMTYDIGLKLTTIHLMALAVFLLAPNLSRLADVFLRHRPAAVREEPPIARTPRGTRRALVALLAFGAYLLGMYTYINVAFWQAGGGGAPKSALYGIWNVERLSIDGEIREPSLADYDRRWRRVIFDEPGRVVFQRTDDSFARYGASLDASARRLSLTKGDSRRWSARFMVERPAADRLVLDGRMDGHDIELDLQRVEFDTLRLLNSPFRWVRPHD